MFAIKNFFTVFVDEGICFLLFAEGDGYFYFVIGFGVDGFLVSASQYSFDAEDLPVLGQILHIFAGTHMSSMETSDTKPDTDSA